MTIKVTAEEWNNKLLQMLAERTLQIFIKRGILTPEEIKQVLNEPRPRPST